MTVADLPLTPNGKLDVAALPAPKRRHRSAAALHSEATTELETIIVQAYEEALMLEPVGLDDDFFALGGDSLGALTMIVELSGKLNAPIREALAFVHTSPRALARALEPAPVIDHGEADHGAGASDSDLGTRCRNALRP